MKQLLFSLLCCTFAMSQAIGQQPENLAVGKAYTLKPGPNYHLCTDPGDRRQLTDGVYTKGYFWTQMTTVGWRNALPVEITVDLGRVQPIGGMSLSSAAGTAGVKWPISISILVSDDDKVYRLAGDLVELSGSEHGEPQTVEYGQYRFATSKLGTRGRFVKLAVFPSGPYFFVDEIEIHKGSGALLNSPAAGEAIEDMDKFYRQYAVTRGLRRRLRMDLGEVRKLAEEVGQDARWRSEFERLEKEIGARKFVAADDFRTVFPMGDLHSRIFEIQAELWRAKGLSGVTIWQKNRWDMLSPTELPEVTEVEVGVEMMQNEYRGAAFNISNCGQRRAEIRLTIEGLPGGVNPDYVAVHEVPFTDTQSGVPVAAAMPLMRKSGSRYVTAVEAGLTRQIWLNFHPQDVEAGEYRGVISIDPGSVRVPIRLKLHPLRFPDEPSLHLGGWDYTDADRRYEVTSKNREEFIRHLREHFVDSPWATGRVLSRGEYDREGNMTEEPETEYFETWVKRWPDARNYYVFASVSDTFAGFKTGTAAFEKAVGGWIRFWAGQLPKWDIEPGQLGILLVDEPHSYERDDRIIAYARVLRKAAPEVVIWEDPTWREPWKARPELFELSDVLCPNLPMLIAEGERFAEFYSRQREAGKTLWFYSCSGPGKLLDPYSYHRLQHWFCWKYQAEGSGFWAFGDSNGASSWNEYLARIGAYTPMFLDESSVTAGKHMEAIREGVEDYEYLVMLRGLVGRLKGQGKSGPAISRAEALLDDVADRVVGGQRPAKLKWSEPKDRSVADKARIQVLRAMSQLAELESGG